MRSWERYRDIRHSRVDIYCREMNILEAASNRAYLVITNGSPWLIHGEEDTIGDGGGSKKLAILASVLAIYMLAISRYPTSQGLISRVCFISASSSFFFKGCVRRSFIFIWDWSYQVLGLRSTFKQQNKTDIEFLHSITQMFTIFIDFYTVSFAKNDSNHFVFW